MDRAYSILNVKKVDEEERVLRGVATTPDTDRMGDIIVSTGVKFKNPSPLLWQHQSDKPVGTVRFDKATDEGITFEAKMPKIEEPGTLKDRVDEAWQSIKAGLVTAVSIGFRPLKDGMEFLDGGGIKFLKTEVLELSLVTIPANAKATINQVKSIDDSLLAASGNRQRASTTPGVSGKQRDKSRKGNPVNIQEQIASFETKRANAFSAQEAIMAKSFESGETLDAEQKENYDTLASEIVSIDEHIERLKAFAAASTANAIVVPEKAGTVADVAKAARSSSPVVSVRRNLPQGAAFTRYAMVLAQSKGNLMQAEVLARRFDKDTPEVSMAIKAAVAAGTTQDSTWAAPLVQLQEMQAEFIEFLRPMTLLGRIPGLRRVPFNIKFTRQTAGTSGTFVGEGLPKPLGKMDFEQLTLGWAKAATLIIMTEELVRFSSPSAEALARDDLAKGIATYLDKRFIDPTYAGVANVSPASITNGVSGPNSTGVTIAAIDVDVTAAVQGFITNNSPNLGGLVWIMNPATALKLSMKRNTDGTKAFPDINPSGGTFNGYAVITSNNVALTGSPTDSFVVLMDPSEIMLADDGGVSIDMSTEASVEMDSAPTGGATSLVSLWQNNLVGLRAERFINWRKRRDTAVAIINNVNW
jgi:HK97 family phage major capsid protein/HK97 family phage prohead protease